MIELTVPNLKLSHQWAHQIPIQISIEASIKTPSKSQDKLPTESPSIASKPQCLTAELANQEPNCIPLSTPRLCRIASILIQKMGPTDLEGGQRGEWGALLVRNKKTQYQTHYGAVKISFRRAGNLKRYILNSNGKPSVSKDTTSWGGHTQTTMQTVKSRQSYQGTTQINSGDTSNNQTVDWCEQSRWRHCNWGASKGINQIQPGKISIKKYSI